MPEDKKKYEKPEASELGSGARGSVQACTSGESPGDCSNNGGLAGVCIDRGTSAGDCTAPGLTAGGACTPVGAAPTGDATCAGPGNLATDCTNGGYATPP